MGSDRARRVARRSGAVRRRPLFLLVTSLVLVMAACRAELPQDSLSPAGDVAREIDQLFRLVFWIAVGVFVLVQGALVYAMIRFRFRPGRDTPIQVHGNNRLEILWTIIPALLLAGVAVPTVSTIFSLAARPAEPVEIRVIGHQWWWEFEYMDEGVVTANEMHIPAGREVLLHLESRETPGGIAGFTPEGEAIPEDAIPVIHSFWVPRLGGKLDLVPGRVNNLTIHADEPGEYRGQCAEYCGLSHANMRMRVIAQTEDGYRAWLDEMRRGPPEPEAGTLAAEGAELFQNFGTGSCLACHGVEPGMGGTVGPNLNRYGARGTLAAGLLPNTEEELRRWLDDPRSVKPGVVMPDYNLTEDQIDALVAYLMSLE
jgi:cytochrome c oxidase subunit II